MRVSGLHKEYLLRSEAAPSRFNPYQSRSSRVGAAAEAQEDTRSISQRFFEIDVGKPAQRSHSYLQPFPAYHREEAEDVATFAANMSRSNQGALDVMSQFLQSLTEHMAHFRCGHHKW